MGQAIYFSPSFEDSNPPNSSLRIPYTLDRIRLH